METASPAGGAPTGAPDVSGASSAPTTDAPSQPAPSRSERLQATLRAVREPAAGARDPHGRFTRDPLAQPAAEGAETEPAGARPSEDGQADANEAPKAPADVDTDKEPSEEPKWLGRRLEQARKAATAPLKARTEALQGELHTAKMDAMRAQEALKVLAAKLDAVVEQRAAGAPFDPRDVEMLHLSLKNEGVEVMRRVDEEGARLQLEQREAEETARLVEQITAEFEGALRAHPLLHPDAFKAAMRADRGRTPIATLAKQLEANERQRLAALGLTPSQVAAQAAAAQPSAPAHAPRTPSTARASAPAASARLSDPREAKLALVASVRGRLGQP